VDYCKGPSVTFEQCTVEDHRKEMMMVEERFRKYRKYPKIHYVIPASRNQVQIKVFLETNVINTTYTMHLQGEEYQVEEDSRGFVTCEYDSKW
jgi:hypothetical protein